MTIYIIIGIVAVVILWAIGIYNRFVSLINRSKEAWSDIDVQLKRRYDLIPNLISTVKGYAEHEKNLFENVTKARSMAMQSPSLEEKSKNENILTNALRSVFAVAEGYPDLKANENFKHLQQELADTENKIQAARRFYNGNVRDLNTFVETFPSNVIAGIFSFAKMEFFELEQDELAAKDPVPVKF